MKIRLDVRKSAQQNASDYYQKAKELARKEEGARQALSKTKDEIEQARVRQLEAAAASRPPSMKRKREWFEKFRWFFTSGGRLVLAGRDARQNDLLVAKRMTDADLFFHADIQGAAATVLVGGKSASRQEMLEAAQFAASHSSAWKAGAAAVDVYAVEKGQLGKHAQGGFVGAGAFTISGTRNWFRGTALGLAMGVEGGRAFCLPSCHLQAGGCSVFLSPSGNIEKGEAAKIIAGILKCGIDDVLLALPSGKFSIRERK
ncbi:MAG: NFACT RNA binding domain-containing protein [Candidatus Micrarchaeota archaeon]|nr:NFACT RNA binding domain-containing protein [Candidatus Micrarchaeota archaeon]